MSKIVCVYHSVDLDGKMSAAGFRCNEKTFKEIISGRSLSKFIEE